uniref:Putative ApbE-like lipoprotein n=1 Tax=uncultured marine Nitrospinaceae bacterium TaxID=482920 RepID=A4GJ06_9BACT|nr:putative ApbE-like lipoprotein [uncultured marine Nitrospinaceae bacterium]
MSPKNRWCSGYKCGTGAGAMECNLISVTSPSDTPWTKAQRHCRKTIPNMLSSIQETT